MKYYYFSNDTKKPESQFNQIMVDLDHGIDIQILLGPNIDDHLANKIAAIGQPVYMDIAVGGLVDEKIKTINSLIDNLAEEVNILVNVSNLTITSVYETINTILSNKNLSSIKIMLYEDEYMDYDYDYALNEQEWNRLIVYCYDHNVNLSWKGEAAGYRYSKYLNEIN